MFRLIGFIIAVYVAYCVLTSHLFATILHVGMWILIALAVVVVSGMIAVFAGSGSAGSASATYAPSARRGSTYEREYARQMRIQTEQLRFDQFRAASEARNEQWRREDAAEQARYDAAVRQRRQW